MFISNLYPPLSIGGYEQVCFDIAEGLKRRGHEVHILTSAYRAEELTQRKPNIDRTLKLKSNWSKSDDPSANWLAANRLSLERHNSKTVRNKLKELEPDIVMVWNGGNMGRALLSAAEGSATPVVYYLTDPWLAPVLANHQGHYVAQAARHLYRFSMKLLGVPISPLRAGNLIFGSRALQSEYQGMGATVKRATVIYHGIDAELFGFREQQILSEEPGGLRRILYAGRLTPEKGVTTLVRAFAQLRGLQDLKRTELALMGRFQSEGYERELRTTIAQLGLDDAITFLPNRPLAELPDVYSSFDVFAFTSEWNEPFALTLLHAMAVGIPVVSSPSGGSVEIVRDGENAVAFQAGDAGDLAHKLAWVLRNRAEAADMGRRASELVRREYTLDKQVSAVETYLGALCGCAS